MAGSLTPPISPVKVGKADTTAREEAAMVRVANFIVMAELEDV